jgi:hypothetical protein
MGETDKVNNMNVARKEGKMEEVENGRMIIRLEKKHGEIEGIKER